MRITPAPPPSTPSAATKSPPHNNSTTLTTIYGSSSSNVVPDSGSEYGDINDDDLGGEGEEGLEKIDETALKAFPVAFMAFNAAYWVNYLVLKTGIAETME